MKAKYPLRRKKHQEGLKHTPYISGRRKQPIPDSATTDSDGRFSTKYFKEVLERLKYQKNRPTTRYNYHGVWKNFNKFVIRLDHKPNTWEEKLSLYCGYLVFNKKLFRMMDTTGTKSCFFCPLLLSQAKHTMMSDIQGSQ